VYFALYIGGPTSPQTEFAIKLLVRICIKKNGSPKAKQFILRNFMGKDRITFRAAKSNDQFGRPMSRPCEIFNEVAVFAICPINILPIEKKEQHPKARSANCSTICCLSW
jgi:hypothetical protein